MGQVIDPEITVTPEIWPLKVGETLTNHDWFPFAGHEFLGSQFVSRSTMQGHREDIGTRMILWCEAIRQNPAGTLPTDDTDLASLAKFKTVDDWLAVRERVLFDWAEVLVEDERSGKTHLRLGHYDQMEELVKDMHRRKAGRDAAREAGNLALKRHKIRKKMEDMGVPRHIIDDNQAITILAKYFDQSGLYITPDHVRTAMIEMLGYTGEVVPISAGRGK